MRERMYHPDTDATIDVLQSAVETYRRSGWLPVSESTTEAQPTVDNLPEASEKPSHFGRFRKEN